MRLVEYVPQHGLEPSLDQRIGISGWLQGPWNFGRRNWICSLVLSFTLFIFRPLNLRKLCMPQKCLLHKVVYSCELLLCILQATQCLSCSEREIEMVLAPIDVSYTNLLEFRNLWDALFVKVLINNEQ